MHGLNLDVPRGDFLALMGPSGSGKTTLLNLMGGIDRPSHGTIEVEGQRIDTISQLCDEPTGDLDRKSGDQILDLLQGLNESQNKTIIMVTHDPLAAARAKRTLDMDKGALCLMSDAA